MDLTKFQEELANTTNPWIKQIGNYLLSRDDIHANLCKKNKSLTECFNYLLIEVSKKCKKEGNTGYYYGQDEELYSLAVHYYDEDDIKVGKKNFSTNADGSATSITAKSNMNSEVKTVTFTEKTIDQEVIDKAVEDALKRHDEELKKKEKEKKEAEKKRKEKAKAMKEAAKYADQSSIFDFLGDENGL